MMNIYYHPMAETKDGDILFLQTPESDYNVALKQFFIWANMGYRIKHAWIDCYADDGIKCGDRIEYYLEG